LSARPANARSPDQPRASAAQKRDTQLM